MIRNLGDHSANERTFLAWVRTSIAIMAFGFLVEKFDLFLAIAARTIDPTVRLPAIQVPDWHFGNALGLMLIVLGTAMIALAALRFRRTAKAIDSADVLPLLSSRVDFVLACLLILLGVCLFIYLVHALVTGL
jgi:putative membrane protein